MRTALLGLVLLLLPISAFAGDGNQFVKGAAVAIRPDTAYLLMRTSTAKENFPVDIVFVRVLSAGELHDATQRHMADPRSKEEPNVVSLWWRDPYAEANGEDTYVMSVKPGVYVLAGQAFGPPHGFLYDDKARGRMGSCLCLGTVKFEAKPGVVTDLGRILAARTDKPITIPELAGYERSTDTGSVVVAMAVVPVSSAMAIPDALKPLPRTDADYRAVGPFPNYFGGVVDRLAPVPGVLGYDKDGRVVDLKAAPPAK